jgi:hypothetical protein
MLLIDGNYLMTSGMKKVLPEITKGFEPVLQKIIELTGLQFLHRNFCISDNANTKREKFYTSLKNSSIVVDQRES